MPGGCRVARCWVSVVASTLMRHGPVRGYIREETKSIEEQEIEVPNVQVLGLFNVKVELVQSAKVNLFQQLPLGADSDGRIADALGLYVSSTFRARIADW